MSSYVSYGPYSLGPNLTYQEKIELVERMCKLGAWSKDACIKYIEELFGNEVLIDECYIFYDDKKNKTKEFVPENLYTKKFSIINSKK
jgi:hypothetical protein